MTGIDHVCLIIAEHKTKAAGKGYRILHKLKQEVTISIFYLNFIVLYVLAHLTFLGSATRITAFDSSMFHYRPQRSWGKVIFSEACVKNSVHGGVYVAGGVGGMHGRGRVWQGGHAWHAHPRQILRDTVIRSMSGRYAYYWNAFLFSFFSANEMDHFSDHCALAQLCCETTTRWC